VTEETRRAIDILYFYQAHHRTKGLKVVIGLQGEVFFARRYLPVLQDDGPISLTMTWAGPNMALTINEAAIQQMEQMGAFVLSDILRKDQPTDFEEHLLRAVHWIANAEMQTNF